MLRPAVFLDRDGVLNRAEVRDGRPYPPKSVATLRILDEAAPACALLREHGFMLICVTNQPDVARGTASATEIDAINTRVRETLRLDALRSCPHDDADGCGCRKPKPGLLLDAAREFAIDLGASFMVGDRWRDIEAGERAGCRTIFIDRDYTEARPRAPGHTARSVLEAARWILSAAAR